MRVAEPGPLVAMKLQSVMNRPTAKERTDLLDIIRLTTDPTAGPLARAQLHAAHGQLKADAARHARRWFVDQRRETFRLVRGIPEGADLDEDSVDLVAQLLLAELE